MDYIVSDIPQNIKKLSEDQAEIPAVHPFNLYPECKNDFNKVSHYHEIVETHTNKRKIYVQLVGPKDVQYTEEAWFKKPDQNINDPIDDFEDELLNDEIDSETDEYNKMNNFKRFDLEDDYKYDEFTDSDDDSNGDYFEKSKSKSKNKSNLNTKDESVIDFFDRNIFNTSLSKNPLPISMSNENIDKKVKNEVHSHEITDFLYFKQKVENIIKGIFIFVHGYADHSTRNFVPLGFETLCNKEGFLIVTYDQYSHGLSEGPRGQIPNVESLAWDLLDIMEFIKGEFPNLPVIVSGTSLGGLVTLVAHILKPEEKISEGIILQSPLIELAVYNHSIYRFGAHLFDKIGLGGYKIMKPVVSNYKNKEVLSAFEKDPYVYHGNVPISTGDSIYKGVQFLKNKQNIQILERYPIFGQFGTADSITDPSGAIFLKNNLSKVTIKVYEGSEHMIYQDILQDKARSDYINWMRMTLSNFSLIRESVSDFEVLLELD